MFYFIITIILLYFIFKIYIRFKSKFWSIQPVYHLYDIHYVLYKPDIIMKKLPEKNNYTDFKNIESLFIKGASNKNIDDCVSLLQNHYFKNKDNKYYPKKKIYYLI